MESKAEFSIVTPISNTNSGLLNIFTKPLIKYDFTRIINYVGRTFGKAGKLLKRNDEDSRISGGLDLSGMRERVAVSAIILSFLFFGIPAAKRYGDEISSTLHSAVSLPQRIYNLAQNQSQE